MRRANFTAHVGAMIAGLVAASVSFSAVGHAQRPDPRGSIFVAQGCNSCHAVWALGVKAESDVGPDLTFAYVDVMNRYGVDLRTFLADPSGVMRLVLTSHLKVNGAARDSIADLLEAIYKQHRAELRHETPPIVADTPTRN